MDRLGSFVLAAAIVLLSALHMLHAPSYWNGVPAVLMVFGLLRLLTRRMPAGADEAPIAVGG